MPIQLRPQSARVIPTPSKANPAEVGKGLADHFEQTYGYRLPVKLAQGGLHAFVENAQEKEIANAFLAATGMSTSCAFYPVDELEPELQVIVFIQKANVYAENGDKEQAKEYKAKAIRAGALDLGFSGAVLALDLAIQASKQIPGSQRVPRDFSSPMANLKTVKAAAAANDIGGIIAAFAEQSRLELQLMMPLMSVDDIKDLCANFAKSGSTTGKILVDTPTRKVYEWSDGKPQAFVLENEEWLMTKE